MKLIIFKKVGHVEHFCVLQSDFVEITPHLERGYCLKTKKDLHEKVIDLSFVDLEKNTNHNLYKILESFNDNSPLVHVNVFKQIG